MRKPKNTAGMPAFKRKNGRFKSGARKVSVKNPAARVSRVRKRHIVEINVNENERQQRGNKMDVKRGRKTPRKVSSIAKFKRSPLLDKGEVVVSLRRYNNLEKDAGTRRRSRRVLSQINNNDNVVYVSLFYVIHGLFCLY